jgi:hypothetical protein
MAVGGAQFSGSTASVKENLTDAADVGACEMRLGVARTKTR